MAKKQTRRSISVSRTTYERLKAFCETNNISMSQLVETRVNDFLGPNDIAAGVVPTGMASPIAPLATRAMSPMAPRTMMSSGLPAQGRSLDVRPAGHSVAAAPPAPTAHAHAQVQHSSQASHAPQASQASVPMTSAAARFAVEPPPPIIKPRQETAAPKPAEKRPEQIFTF